MKRPAFQFYPSDWRKDPALSACSMAARGLWIELMCIAHEADNYGHLEINGKAMTAPQLARMVGESPSVVTKLVAELDGAGVFSRTTEGVIFSRRMVKDERIRNIRAEAGRLGGNPNLVKQKDNHLLNQNSEQKPTPSSSSSSSPIHSEPNGSGASPPPADLPAPVLPKPEPAVKPAKPKLTDPADIIFGYGLSMLTNAGTKDSTARSFLGGLRKIHGDAALIDKLRICAQERVLQPLEWLAAALPPPNVAGKPNAQEALEAANAAVLSKFLAEDAHAAH